MDVGRVVEYIPLVCRSVCNTRLRSQYRILLNSPGILLGLLDIWSMGTIGYTETSVGNYQPTLRYVQMSKDVI